MADADDSSSTGLPGATSAQAPPQPAADVAASFEEASLREDQIQNAVAFLSHPKALVLQPAQPGAVVPLQQQQQQLMAPAHQPVRWTQVMLGLGVAAASLYGLHQLLAPRISAWTHQLSESRRAAQEAEAARTAALTAALERLSEGQGKLLESVEGLAATLQQQQQQQRPGSSQAVHGTASASAYRGPVAAQSSISFQQQQLTYDEQARCQSPGAAAAAAGMGSLQRQQQEQQYSNNVRGWDPYADPSRDAAMRSAGFNGSAVPGGAGYSSASNFSQPQQQQQQQEGVARSVAGAAVGAAEGFEVVPRGMAPASEAMWGASSSQGPSPAGTAVAGAPQAQRGGGPDEPPRSAAFQEVMQMVRAGITPANVRSDIDDSPPDPARPISAPQLAARAKPWERSSVGSNSGSRPAAYGGGSPPPSSMGGDIFHQQQQQQQRQQHAIVGSNIPDVPDAHSSYGVAVGASSYAASATAAEAAGPGSSSSIVDGMEPAAVSSRRKSVETAGAAYDLSHLLGSDAGSSDAPWRPPPPPAPTVMARPGSSGSSSSRTGTGMAVPAAGAAEVAAPDPSVEQVVAEVAATAVQSVVAASGVAGPQGMEAAPA
ncbi:hypothetical protein COO60DRAFT_1701891 [Scenedesmus sp. NREL 46B-D3]|nr:hypothetical protein COO60DRAFT_1701891 [Scenedesmus sp. NREL 46B-D3]